MSINGGIDTKCRLNIGLKGNKEEVNERVLVKLLCAPVRIQTGWKVAMEKDIIDALAVDFFLASFTFVPLFALSLSLPFFSSFFFLYSILLYPFFSDGGGGGGGGDSGVGGGRERPEEWHEEKFLFSSSSWFSLPLWLFSLHCSLPVFRGKNERWTSSSSPKSSLQTAS